jgi:thymidylate synthase (FAD)
MVDVELLEMPDDPERLVCRCARNDYYTGSVFEDDFETVMESVGGDTLEEKKKTLLQKLMLRGHWGVFEHPQMTLWYRVSRSCMAQITRHRHVSFDIQSMRYVDFSDADPSGEEDFRWPRTWDQEKVQVREGKRAMEGSPDERAELIEETLEQCVDAYRELVDRGMPKEDARMLLPIGTKVNITSSLNVRTALHIVSMRGAGDAQAEIQHLSDGIREILEEQMPTTMEIWNDKQRAIERQRLTP